MTFDFINAVIHLLYENPDIFITTLFSSTPTFFRMREWLNNQKIEFNWLNHIKEEDLPLLTGRNEVIQIEALLHIDIQGELDAFIAKNRLETHYLLFLNKGYDETSIQNIQKKHKGLIFYSTEEFDEDRYMFSNPAQILMQALFNADKWPGILKLNSDDTSFIPLTSCLLYTSDAADE